MRLVPDWRQAWKWLSVHAMVLAGAIQGAWLFVPADMKANVPAGLLNVGTAVLMVLGVAGRLIDQGDKHNDA